MSDVDVLIEIVHRVYARRIPNEDPRNSVALAARRRSSRRRCARLRRRRSGGVARAARGAASALAARGRSSGRRGIALARRRARPVEAKREIEPGGRWAMTRKFRTG